MSINIPSTLSRRLRLVFSFLGVLLLLGGFAKTLNSEVVRPLPNKSLTFSTLVDSDVRIAVVHAEDGIHDLNRRVDLLEKDHDTLASVQQRLDKTYLLVQYAAGALLSLCAKDLLTAVINFLKAKTPPTT